MKDYFEFFTKSNDFKGKTTRKIYWFTQLFIYIINLLIYFVIKDNSLASIWSLLILVPSTSITVRRLHDANKSGKWLLGYIPLIISIVILSIIGAIGTSISTTQTITQFLSNNIVPISISFVCLIAGIVFSIIIFVFTLFPSVKENNKYDKISQSNYDSDIFA